MSSLTSRLGVFGGSFDPPHLAHVALAQVAVQQLNLQRLVVLPTGQAWHKSRVLSSAAHRLAMAQAAFSDVPDVSVDDREMTRAGPTYTVDTLRELRAEFPAAQLCLIIGADQSAALPTWREWKSICQLAIICIADREGQHSVAVPNEVLEQAHIEHLQMPLMPLSATDIRSRVAIGLGIAHLVPPGVARYIENNHLYLDS